MKRHTLKYALLSLMSLSLLVLGSSVSQAVFAGLGVNTNTATATTGAGTVSMAVFIKDVAGNGTATQITWPTVNLPSAFVVASQYIELHSTITAGNGGIQIYTDNTNPADANPKYTGLIDANNPPPSGLVNITNTAARLPTAWQIKDVLGVPTAINPNDLVNGSGWLFHEDKAQVANQNQNVTAFANGVPFVTVESLACAGSGASLPCIHFGQRDTDFGIAASPNYIYTQADFSNAVGGSTYKTSTLRLEAFTQ
jgi:hypothetical protein